MILRDGLTKKQVSGEINGKEVRPRTKLINGKFVALTQKQEIKRDIEDAAALDEISAKLAENQPNLPEEK
tara:strand:- start:250 stop:459 length:210 start_codon:yes stop_codon:yes gene_type:complete